jgi:hypothetical protein
LWEFVGRHTPADDRDGLVILIANLHWLEIATLTLDPATTGTDRDQMALAELKT